MQPRLSRDLLVYGLGEVLVKAFSLITLPIYTRTFTPEEFGTLSILVKVSGFARAISAGRSRGGGIWRDGGPFTAYGGHARQRHDQLLGHLEAHAVLRLGGGRTQVRRQHEVRSIAQRIIGRHWVQRVDVNGGTGKVAGSERIGEGSFIHDAAAGHVEDECAGLRRLQLSAAEEVARLPGQWCVDGDDVGTMQQLGQANELRADLRCLLLGQVGSVASTRISKPVARRATALPILPRR